MVATNDEPQTEGEKKSTDLKTKHQKPDPKSKETISRGARATAQRSTTLRQGAAE